MKSSGAKSHRIFWNESQETASVKLEFDGVPFKVLGVRVLECQNGPDRNKTLKQRLAQERNVSIQFLARGGGEGGYG